MLLLDNYFSCSYSTTHRANTRLMKLTRGKHRHTWTIETSLVYKLKSQCHILISCYWCPAPAPAPAPDPRRAAATAPASLSVEGKYEGSAPTLPAECTAAAPFILILLTLTHF